MPQLIYPLNSQSCWVLLTTLKTYQLPHLELPLLSGPPVPIFNSPDVFSTSNIHHQSMFMLITFIICLYKQRLNKAMLPFMSRRKQCL